MLHWLCCRLDWWFSQNRGDWTQQRLLLLQYSMALTVLRSKQHAQLSILKYCFWLIESATKLQRCPPTCNVRRTVVNSWTSKSKRRQWKWLDFQPRIQANWFPILTLQIWISMFQAPASSSCCSLTLLKAGGDLHNSGVQNIIDTRPRFRFCNILRISANANSTDRPLSICATVWKGKLSWFLPGTHFTINWNLEILFKYIHNF